MTRHEISQLKVKDKVVIQTGLYAGKVGVIERIDLSAAFPNGSLSVMTDGVMVKVSGVEISRYMGKEEYTEELDSFENPDDEEDHDNPHLLIGGDEFEEDDTQDLGEMEHD